MTALHTYNAYHQCTQFLVPCVVHCAAWVGKLTGQVLCGAVKAQGAGVHGSTTVTSGGAAVMHAICTYPLTSNALFSCRVCAAVCSY